MDVDAGSAGLRFGEFQLSTRPLGLTRDGAIVALRPQALRLLALFAARPATLVTQEEIRRHLWGERHVDFARGIHLLVREIRQALDDDAERPRFIETIPRQGYRFIADVAPVETAPRRFEVRDAAMILGAAGAAIALAAALYFAPPIVADRDAPPSPAREATLKGEYLFDKGGAKNLAASAEKFNEALGLDAAYAPAHAGLAEIAVMKGDFERAEAHARKALERDAGFSDAYLHLGMIAAMRDWDWREAERLVDKAIRLDPRSAKAFSSRALLMTILGRREEALAATARAHDLDPVSALIKTDHGWFQYYAGDFAGAMRSCAEAAALAPENYSVAHCELKAAAAAGDMARASAAAARILGFWTSEDALGRDLRDRPSKESLDRFYAWQVEMLEGYAAKGEAPADALAAARAAAGDFAGALDLLDKAAGDRASLLPLALRDPVFAPLRADPRFAALIERAGLADAGTM